MCDLEALLAEAKGLDPAPLAPPAVDPAPAADVRAVLEPDLQAAVNMVVEMLHPHLLANPGLLMHPVQSARLHGFVEPVEDSEFGQDEPDTPGVLTALGRRLVERGGRDGG